MCFFSKQTKTAIEVQHRFKATVKDSALFAPVVEYNGFAFPQTPVIINSLPTIIDSLSWGLIPHWAHNSDIRKFTLNAKIETLHEKPSFRNVINNRCLVISDGFYEWQWLDSKGKQKQKYEITLRTGELFAFAGIWSQWKHNITGELVKTYSIITTKADLLMSEIHNSKKRMPLILTPNNELSWLQNTPVLDFANPTIDLVAHKI